MEYFYKDAQGQIFGPFEEAFIRDLRAKGIVKDSTDLNILGSSIWKSLGELLPMEDLPPTLESPSTQLEDQSGDTSKISKSLDIDSLLLDFKQKYEVIYSGDENNQMEAKVFFGSEIPYEKLIGAYAGYAYEAKSNNDFNLVLLDDTLSGDSKKGFLATNAGVYFKNMMEKGSFIEWPQIQSIQSKTGFLGSKILINHNLKIEMQPWHGKKLATLLEAVLQFLCKNTKLLPECTSVASTDDPDKASFNQQYHPDLDIDPEIKQVYSPHFLMLEEMLSEGEMVHAIARGVGGFGKAGKEIAVATNKRILLFRQILNLLMPQFEQEEFYWSDVESIKLTSGMFMSEIIIRTRGGEFGMKNVSSDDASGFVAFTNDYLQQFKTS